ncbi:hypothetical protein AVEN_128471-1 [Araneus ventricosus]|uniref:Uncharacterized protein n=1 Tax=Araneus ventricosus TaxID=182803 RepID=A0A4Y2RPD3_ARAVE|nr:hypothetical protein AVEN_128471-1 [Araneus ventricosus]
MSLTNLFQPATEDESPEAMCFPQNPPTGLLKLWIGISNSESAESERIQFRFTNPIPRIRSFWSESDPDAPFKDPDPRIRSGVNDTSLLERLCLSQKWHLALCLVTMAV